MMQKSNPLLSSFKLKATWKAFILLFTFQVFCITNKAQTPSFLGMNRFGINSEGILFKVNGDGSGFSDLYDFKQYVDSSGLDPFGTLCKAINNKYYGVTYSGGTGSIYSGVIFSFDLSTNSYQRLYTFGQTSATFPMGYDQNFIQANNGLLYAMSWGGGLHGGGAIYTLDPSTNAYAEVYQFNKPTGELPHGNFTYTANGKFYGTTFRGGANDSGTVFSYNPNSNVYQMLSGLNSSTGDFPSCTLVQASNGKLYGTTVRGGLINQGSIFSLDTGTNLLTKVYDFDTLHGYYTEYSDNAILASDGKIYGTTALGGGNGGGVLYSFDPVSNTYNVEYHFTNSTGYSSVSAPLQASDGNLYGMTNLGGAHGLGVVFRYDLSTHTYTDIMDFDATVSGKNPTGGLVELPLGVGIISKQENQFELFPNPAKESVRISCPNPIDEIRVTDVSGREIQLLKPLQNNYSLQMNGPGIFFVTVISKGGISTKKIIVLP